MHVGRQPEEQHPGVKPSTEHCFWGAAVCTPRHPDTGLLRRGACSTNVKGDSELEGSLCPTSNPTSSLSHHSHPGPCTHLFSLGTSAWRPSQRWKKGLRVTSLVCRDGFPSRSVPGHSGKLGCQGKQSRGHALSMDLEPVSWKIQVSHSFVVLSKT